MQGTSRPHRGGGGGAVQQNSHPYPSIVSARMQTPTARPTHSHGVACVRQSRERINPTDRALPGWCRFQRLDSGNHDIIRPPSHLWFSHSTVPLPPSPVGPLNSGGFLPLLFFVFPCERATRVVAHGSVHVLTDEGSQGRFKVGVCVCVRVREGGKPISSKKLLTE